MGSATRSIPTASRAMPAPASPSATAPGPDRGGASSEISPRRGRKYVRPAAATSRGQSRDPSAGSWHTVRTSTPCAERRPSASPGDGPRSTGWPLPLPASENARNFLGNSSGRLGAPEATIARRGGGGWMTAGRKDSGDPSSAGSTIRVWSGAPWTQAASSVRPTASEWPGKPLATVELGLAIREVPMSEAELEQRVQLLTRMLDSSPDELCSSPPPAMLSLPIRLPSDPVGWRRTR